MTMRTTRILVVAALLTGFTTLSGCNSNPLRGTRWRVAQWIAADPPAFDRGTVEFRKNGQILTSLTASDNTVLCENRAHFKVKDDTLTFEGPDFPPRGMFCFDGVELRLHTEDFILVLEPVEEY